MIVSTADRFVFVHVQKTGGISVQQLLLDTFPAAGVVEGLPRHVMLDKALAAHPEFTGFFIFGAVRNPWARMVSWWEMVQRWKAESDSKGARQLNANPFLADVATYPSFEHFVAHGHEKWARLRVPQVDYLTRGDRRADYIMRTETLDADLRAVMVRLGATAPPAVPHRNVGAPRDFRELYTPALRDEIGERFGRDVAAFGYSFDPA